MKFLKYVAISCYIQCCYSEQADRIDSYEKFFHFVTEISFRAHASRIINDPQAKTFLQNKKYNETLYKVIAKAMADCRFGNIFFDKIVVFKNTNAENYTLSNWNAVVLYNFLASVFDEQHNNFNIDDEMIDNVSQKVNEYYQNKYVREIEKAVHDIKQYAKDLRLYEYIQKMKGCMRHPSKIAPCITVFSYFDEDTCSAQFAVTSTYLDINNAKVLSHMLIKIRNAKIAECCTTKGFYEKITYDLKVDCNKSQTKPVDFEKTLLKESEIKNLFNYVKGYPITNGRCYFNSTLQCFNASYYYREGIKQHQLEPKPMQKMDCDISKVLNQFISTNQDKDTVFGSVEKYCNAILKVREIYDNYLALDEYNKRVSKILLNSKNIDKEAILKNKIAENKDMYKHFVSKTGEEGGYSSELCTILLPALCNQLRTTGNDIMMVADNIKLCNYNGTETILNEYGMIGYHTIYENDVDDITEELKKQFNLYKDESPQNPNEPYIVSRILRLPKILIINIIHHKNTYNNQKVSETMTFNDTEGMKKYKLVAVAATDNVYSNHQVADIRTQEGWITISDYGTNKIRGANKYYQPNEEGFYPYRDRNMLVYQLIN